MFSRRENNTYLHLNRLFPLLFLSFQTVGFSQFGPGGVGSNDGTSTLEFWYMAEGEPYSDGDLVNSVSDHSGNTRTLTASGGERPTFTSETSNNLPSFLFNLNQELETTYQGNSNENMSFGIMMKTTSNNGLNIAIQHGGRNTAGIDGSGFYADFVGGANQTSTTAANTDWTYHSKTFANSGANRLKYYINNTNTDNFTHTIQNTTSNTWIGGHGTGGGTGYRGNIAEVYKYSKVLNRAEQIIIANYFSAKYNTLLTQNDIYTQDNAVNGDYDHDVAGIGRINGSNLHNDSQGSGIVRILNPTHLGNNEFLFWGHDNGALRALETSDVPAGVTARFTRIWRVNERNTTNTADVNVGNIDMRWDLSDQGNVTASDLRLLIDTDNDGNFSNATTISGANSLGNGIYEFPTVTGIQNNAQFTLGTINVTQTPLPVQLLNFTAITQTGEVKLDWQTASEQNNDYFSIERSINGTEWRTISIINGSGNSSSTLSYSFTDEHPSLGTSYYRLKQTDFDGNSEYFRIQSVDFRKEDVLVSIFPNPTQNKITLSGNIENLGQITLLNSLSENVTAFITKSVKDQNQLEVDMSKLLPGVYFLSTKNGVFKVIKK